MKSDKIIAVRVNKTIYREGDRCVKVFRESFSKSQIFSEALNHVKIEEAGVTVPKIIEVTKTDGRWSIISEYIKGSTLERLMELDPENKTGHLRTLARLQTEIHKKVCPALPSLKEKISRKISMAELYDPRLKNRLYEILDGIPDKNNICHGDFIPSNILVAENEKIYITDWPHAARGDGAADAAETFLRFALTGNKDAAREYLELFCDISGRSEKDVRMWLPLVAAARLANNSAKEREFLLRQVDVVDL